MSALTLRKYARLPFLVPVRLQALAEDFGHDDYQSLMRQCQNDWRTSAATTQTIFTTALTHQLCATSFVTMRTFRYAAAHFSATQDIGFLMSAANRYTAQLDSIQFRWQFTQQKLHHGDRDIRTSLHYIYEAGVLGIPLDRSFIQRSILSKPVPDTILEGSNSQRPAAVPAAAQAVVSRQAPPAEIRDPSLTPAVRTVPTDTDSDRPPEAKRARRAEPSADAIPSPVAEHRPLSVAEIVEQATRALSQYLAPVEQRESAESTIQFTNDIRQKVRICADTSAFQEAVKIIGDRLIDSLPIRFSFAAYNQRILSCNNLFPIGFANIVNIFEIIITSKHQTNQRLMGAHLAATTLLLHPEKSSPQVQRLLQDHLFRSWEPTRPLQLADLAQSHLTEVQEGHARIPRLIANVTQIRDPDIEGPIYCAILYAAMRLSQDLHWPRHLMKNSIGQGRRTDTYLKYLTGIVKIGLDQVNFARTTLIPVQLPPALQGLTPQIIKNINTAETVLNRRVVYSRYPNYHPGLDSPTVTELAATLPPHTRISLPSHIKLPR